MTVLENAQKSLKVVIDQADALEAKVNSENRTPNDDEMKQFGAFAEQANQLTKQVGDLKALAAAKGFGESSSGSVVAAAQFAGEDVGIEGMAQGVSADPVSGDIYSLDGIGEKRVKFLKSGEYKDAFNDMVRSTALKRAMKASSMKVLAEVGFANGEAWLPPDYRAELIKKVATMTSVRRNASVYTTGTDAITFPSVNYPTDDQYTWGGRFTWRGSSAQTGDISEATNPVSGQIKIPVNLATMAVIVQREQVEDNAFDLMGYVTESGGESFSLGEEDAFTNGDGNGKPWGFMQHPSVTIDNGSTSALNGVTYQGGRILSGASDQVAWGTATTGLIGMEAALPPQYEPGAKWFASKLTYAAIRAINAGTATLPQWSLGDAWPNYANNYQASLLGYGIEKNQFMPAISGTTYPVAFGNMKGYFIADRVGLSVEVNPYVYQLRDQVVIYMRKRVGGQLVRSWAMKFLKSNGS